MAGVEVAFGMADSNPGSVILLGAAATRAETSYGWIEAGTAISGHSCDGLLHVKKFWEKPSRDVAGFLLDRGCVWNTFVMVGGAQAYLDLIQSAAPGVYEAFQSATPLETVYAGLATSDFSTVVLSAAAEKLGLLCLGDVGWSDMGDPKRVIPMLPKMCAAHQGAELWSHEAAAAAAGS